MKLENILNKLNSTYRIGKQLLNGINENKDLILAECNISKNLIENLYLINNNLKEIPKCSICNNNLKFESYKNGYIKTCGNKKCIDKYIKIKREQTMLNKYGVINAYQLEEFKDKIKQTNLKKYGSESVMNNKEIKQKQQNTIKEKYGVNNISQLDEIKRKKEKTSLKKFGVKYHTELQSEKDKLSKIAKQNFEKNGDEIIKKRIETNLNIYGTEHALQNKIILDKLQKTNLEKYGYTTPGKNELIKEKAANTSIKKYGYKSHMQNSLFFDNFKKSKYKKKDYTLPSGKIIKVQGYENLGLDLLLESYTEKNIINNQVEMSKYIGEIFYIGLDNKQHRYYPDIYIISENKIIEVKSKYTYNADKETNLLKMKACLNKRFKFEFMIFNSKQNLLKLDENYKIIK